MCAWTFIKKTNVGLCLPSHEFLCWLVRACFSKSMSKLETVRAYLWCSKSSICGADLLGTTRE
jgi:hypothetical protein